MNIHVKFTSFCRIHALKNRTMIQTSASNKYLTTEITIYGGRNYDHLILWRGSARWFSILTHHKSKAFSKLIRQNFNHHDDHFDLQSFLLLILTNTSCDTNEDWVATHKATFILANHSDISGNVPIILTSRQIFTQLSNTQYHAGKETYANMMIASHGYTSMGLITYYLITLAAMVLQYLNMS